MGDARHSPRWDLPRAGAQLRELTHQGAPGIRLVPRLHRDDPRFIEWAIQRNTDEEVA